MSAEELNIVYNWFAPIVTLIGSVNLLISVFRPKQHRTTTWRVLKAICAALLLIIGLFFLASAMGNHWASSRPAKYWMLAAGLPYLIIMAFDFQAKSRESERLKKSAT
jgi:protein-S-isoprenylcysteine O-methyltransferase Ste14